MGVFDDKILTSLSFQKIAAVNLKLILEDFVSMYRMRS